MQCSDGELINKFLATELNLHLTNNFNPIERAHRLGPENRQIYDQKRPIIVKFLHYNDTETILKNAFKLKGSNFTIDRDYPHDIVVARRKMFNSRAAQQARAAGKRVVVKYPAKLFIDNRFEDDALPDWYDLMRESRTEGFEPTTPVPGPLPEPEYPPHWRKPSERRREEEINRQPDGATGGQSTADRRKPGQNTRTQISRDNNNTVNTQNIHVQQSDVTQIAHELQTKLSKNRTSKTVNSAQKSPDTLVKQLFKVPVAPRGRSESQSKNVNSKSSKQKSTVTPTKQSDKSSKLNSRGSQVKPTPRGRARSLSTSAINRQRVKPNDSTRGNRVSDTNTDDTCMANNLQQK
jgi:hypothetical protein